MGRSTLWSLGFLFGVLVILASAFSLLVGLAVILVSLAFIAWRGRVAGLAGLFTGFGGFWLLLVVAAFRAGDEPNNSALPWLLVGIVPLIIGVVLRSQIGSPASVALPPEPVSSNLLPSNTVFPKPDAELMPAESTSSEPTAVEVMSAESTSSEPTAIEVMPAERASSEPTSAEVMPSESTSFDPTAVEVMPSETFFPEPDSAQSMPAETIFSKSAPPE